MAEADNNAVAVFALSPASADVPGAPGDDRLAGRIPVDWYPTVLAPLGDSLLVLSAKGSPPAANPDWGHPGRHGDARNYTLGQLTGTLAALAMARPGAALDQLTARVARANRWDQHAERPANRADGRYPPIEHVIYVIKENRTYDQVLGDLPAGDGDTALVFFPRAVTPNHHALAERFGLFDRFFVNAEVSADGHSWSTAAYATDYLEKTVPSLYSDRGRTYDYEGTNRGDMDSTRGTIAVPDDDVAEPANGYLWNLAQQAGITFRNYGEFVISVPGADPDDAPVGYQGAKPFLATHTHPTFPGFNMEIPDQQRADIWIAELAEFGRRGEMPRLQIVRLPNDHTAGAKVGAPTPRAYMADNDLALGRMVEALSRSPFWRSTAIFVLEDDAQDGPDHVDSHRSPLLVISPWAPGRGAPPLGQHHRRDRHDGGDPRAGLAVAVRLLRRAAARHLARRSGRGSVHRAAPGGAAGRAQRGRCAGERRVGGPRPGVRGPNSRRRFNRILWRAIKGEGVAYPEPEQLSAPEWAGVAARSR